MLEKLYKAKDYVKKYPLTFGTIAVLLVLGFLFKLLPLVVGFMLGYVVRSVCFTDTK